MSRSFSYEEGLCFATRLLLCGDALSTVDGAVILNQPILFPERLASKVAKCHIAFPSNVVEPKLRISVGCNQQATSTILIHHKSILCAQILGT